MDELDTFSAYCCDYMWSAQSEGRITLKEGLVVSGVIEHMNYCPYCGELIKLDAWEEQSKIMFAFNNALV